jgi:hypothetical protein
MMSRKQLPTKDALGNEVVLGATYGYTSTEGSRASVVIGRTIKFSSSGWVSLKMISRKVFINGEQTDDGWADHRANKVATQPYLLFPVPCSLFPVPCSLFPVPCSLFPVPCSLFPVPDPVLSP